MSEHRPQFDPAAAAPFNAGFDMEREESICCLQYMIAFLLEKNEQIRQELAARNSD